MATRRRSDEETSQRESARESSRARRFRPARLGTRLFLVLVVFALGPLFISNLWGYVRTRDRLVGVARAQMQDRALAEASRVSSFLDRTRDVLPSLIADNEHLYSLMRSMLTCSAAGDCATTEERLVLHLAAKAEETGSLEEMVALSSTGRVLAGSRGLPTEADEDGSAAECFRRGRAAPTLVGVVHEDGAPMLIAGAPIFDEGGVLLGVLCGGFELDVERNAVPRPSQTTLTLFDDAGAVLASPVTGAPIPVEAEPLRDRALALWPAGSPAETWVSTYEHSTQGEVLAAFAPVPDQSWLVMVTMPTSAATEELELLKWQAIGFSALLTLALVVVASLTARRLAAPLVLLSEAAARVAEGALGEQVRLRGPLEVVRLAIAFNRMSVALEESRSLLEQRIAVRTAELERSREFLTHLLDSIGQRVLVVSKDSVVLQANRTARRMHGEGIVGRRLLEVLGPSPAGPVAIPSIETFHTSKPGSAERSENIAGTVEVMKVETFPVLSPEGEVEAVLEISRNVTDEKRNQAQMVYQEKMASFGLVAAGIAHDIGNPLASIEGQLRMARGKPDPERMAQTLDVVEKEVGRIGRLIRDLVNFARRRRERVQAVDVNACIDDVGRLIAHDPRARSVEIRFELTRDLPPIRAKEDDLVQVLMNLGLNALDAMPDGGLLVFESRVQDGGVVVEVRDTGRGIGPEHVDQIFTPFFTTKPPGRGTGLGLFVSREILASLGGRLDLRHTGPEGSAFAVWVPFERPASEEKES